MPRQKSLALSMHRENSESKKVCRKIPKWTTDALSLLFQVGTFGGLKHCISLIPWAFLRRCIPRIPTLKPLPEMATHRCHFVEFRNDTKWLTTIYSWVAHLSNEVFCDQISLINQHELSLVQDRSFYKVSRTSSQNLLRYLGNGQTDRPDDYITALAEVTKWKVQERNSMCVPFSWERAISACVSLDQNTTEWGCVWHFE